MKKKMSFLFREPQVWREALAAGLVGLAAGLVGLAAGLVGLAAGLVALAEWKEGDVGASNLSGWARQEKSSCDLPELVGREEEQAHLKSCNIPQ